MLQEEEEAQGRFGPWWSWLDRDGPGGHDSRITMDNVQKFRA